MLKFVLLVIILAACIYFVVRAVEKRGGPSGGARPAKPRPLGPDDDPDFLWDLNRKIKDPRKPGDSKKPGDSEKPGDPAPSAADQPEAAPTEETDDEPDNRA